MSELQVLREEIDAIDRQIVALFEQRMAVTEQVGRYKQSVGMPVLDAGREREVLRKKAECLTNSDLKTEVSLLYQSIMAISRRQQRQLVEECGSEDDLRIQTALAAVRDPVEHPRVVYQGEPGAYSEMAVLRFFGPDVQSRGLTQFEDVFDAIKQGRADYGVLPIENTSTGAIRQVYDLLSTYECYLVGEVAVPVSHCLMGLPGSRLEDIQSVYSHEQGLFQCEGFLREYPSWKRIPQADTAGSARMVADGNDQTKAAICSKRSAELYGLQLLAEGINDRKENTTRFVVVSPNMELRKDRTKISACFCVPHQSGSLHEVLTIFAAHGWNLLRLESRPMPGQKFQYMFFVEFTGDLLDPEMTSTLRELTQSTEGFRVFGNFAANLGEQA